MSGTVLENLSGRKLAALVAVFLVCQITCFLIGGLIAPKPSITDSVLATQCIDEKNNSDAWFYIRGPSPCNSANLDEFSYDEHITYANKIVFVFQIPSPRERVMLDYSRWQQNLIGIIDLTILYQEQNEIPPQTVLTIDAKLGYQNKGDPPGHWNFYAKSLEHRNLDCSIDVVKEGYPYNCSLIPLFELGSLHHDYYLLNIRLPVDHDSSMNIDLGHIADVWLYAINQTGGFTKVWVSLKCFFFPMILAVMIWFWNRVRSLPRKPLLLECMLLFVACALTLMNLPLELLTIYFELPSMLLLNDIKQGIFNASLLSFWLIFAAEHLMIQDSQKNHLRSYWLHLSCVVIGCTALFMFEMCERGIKLKNPFYTIWVTDFGTKIAMALLIIGGLSGAGYFVILCYLIWKVFRNIGTKKSSLPAMSQARRLHYMGVIYRFNFLMAATLICAALTVIAFTIGQVSESQLRWEEHQSLEYTSAFFTGVYGMWNIYIFALLVLYAPSHKQTADNESTSTSNEIEFASLVPEHSTEISSMTSLAKKSALD